MAYLNFVIPGNKADLLRSAVADEYTVKNVSVQKELLSELKNDTTMVRAGISAEELMQTSKGVEDKAEEWVSANMLKLNKDKTQKIMFSTNSNLTSNHPAKLLGIVLDDGLRWEYHADQHSVL